ncbi:MAG: ATP-binding protein [Egibacteraceae bacterium]
MDQTEVSAQTEIRLLGPLQVVVDGEVVALGGPKQRTVLALLALRLGRPVSVSTLVDAVWEDGSHDGAVRSLRTYASNIRRLLGAGVHLTADQGSYTLSAHDVWSDVVAFEDALRHADDEHTPAGRCRAFGAALDLWRGRVLADLDGTWLQAEAQRLAQHRHRAVVAYGAARLALGDEPAAVDSLRDALRDAPLDEHAAALLMRALYLSGHQSEALAVFRSTADMLAEQLGVDPGLELREAQRDVLHHDVVSAREGPPPLPAASTPLLGRQDEVDALMEALDSRRLITLLGPGGVGKTRLALEVGHRVARSGARQVHLADLVPVTDPRAVEAVMAAAAQVQPHPDGGPLDALSLYLRHRDDLFIVDNCEHVAAAVVHLTAVLLRACPDVTILCTSRVPLHVRAELRWRVPPLAVPDEPGLPLDELRQTPAVQLLLDRAPHGVELTSANAGAIVDLCCRLDGLPLALELAASRLGHLTPAEVEASLRTHTDPPPTVGGDRRQATLDATIGWSHELLPDGPRQLLPGLGVLAGRFTVDDAVAVCAPDVPPDLVRGWLSTLVQHSLLMSESTAHQTRYWLLETVRVFALDRLGGGTPAFRRSHARHFAQVAQHQAGRLLTAAEADAVTELAASHDNLRSAVSWAMDDDDLDSAAAIVSALPDWAYFRSRYELSRWAERVVGAIDGDHLRWRAVCGAAARGAWVDGRFDDALRFGTAGMSGSSDGAPVMARSGHPDDVVADVGLYRGEADQAVAHYRAVLASAEAADDAVRSAWAAYYLAVCHAVGRDHAQAAAWAGRAAQHTQRTANPTARAQALYASGLAAKHSDPARASVLLEESVGVAQSVGNDWFGGIARTELAAVEAGHGDLDRALQLFATMIDRWFRAGDLTQLRLLWRYLVWVLEHVSRPADAAVLTGALDADAHAVLTHPSADLRRRLQDALGDEAYTRLSTRGSVASIGALVELSGDAVRAAQAARAGRGT